MRSNSVDEMAAAIKAEGPRGMVFPRRDLSIPIKTSQMQMKELEEGGLFDLMKQHPSPVAVKFGAFGFLLGLLAAALFTTPIFPLLALSSAVLIGAFVIKQTNDIRDGHSYIELTGISREAQSRLIEKIYAGFVAVQSTAVIAMRKMGVLSEPTAKVMLKCSMRASILAGEILSCKPLLSINKTNDRAKIVDAWIFALAVELFWIVKETSGSTPETRAELSKKLTNFLAYCIGSPSLCTNLLTWTNLFEAWWVEYLDPVRQFIPRQGLMFSYLIARRGNDISDELEKDGYEYSKFMRQMVSIRTQTSASANNDFIETALENRLAECD